MSTAKFLTCAVKKEITILFTSILLFTSGASAQILGGSIHGNLQFDGQYYLTDSLIGAPEVPEKFLSNGFANFIYERGNFSAGLRYENYTNPILGFDSRYKGNGIPYRYLNYKNDELEITAGNFYDQFGSGVVFRTYEERGLGLDNAMDGFRLKYNPVNGVYFKGIIGYQRNFFSKGEGIVRGGDLEWNINESLKCMDSCKTKFILGGNFVSKYQDDQDPVYILPKNVGAGSGRLSIIHGNFTLTGEYAQKANDPSATNGFIYKDGSATIITATYSRKGFGLTLAGKRIDNMSFRSERTATLNSLIINYLPALTKNHTNMLAALYPYATQPNGEYGGQVEVFYLCKPNSALGGKYGTDVTMNYSRAQSIDKKPTGDDDGYTSDFIKFGDDLYYEDFNFEINHKWNKKLRSIISYVYINYNKDVIEGREGFGHVYSHIGIIETNWKMSSKNSLRTELQHLYTKQDKQSWALVLAEFSVTPHWFVAAFDEYNYGNKIVEQRIHYYTGTFGYTRGTNRIQFGYGRQRAGIFCVGGVCRTVPASNGFTLSVTSSF
ncbi:MAG: DUF6029 family protein [Bacteroidota bacterium]